MAASAQRPAGDSVLKHGWQLLCIMSLLVSTVCSLQNRVGELYSLIRFLRIFPYAFYFCGAGTAKTSKIPPCDCRSLDHPFKKNHRKCDHCGCALHPSWVDGLSFPLSYHPV